jgi:diguanylate cyclase (GGDEF)-like protein/PAS domain S-box-containing protein
MQHKTDSNIPASTVRDVSFMQNGLQEHSEMMQKLLDSMPAIMFSVDRKFVYTAFNQAHVESMRVSYGVEIKLGYSILDFINVEEDRSYAAQNLEQALLGEPVYSSAYFGQEALSRIYFETRYIPIFAPDYTVTGVAVFAQDITQLKTTEEDLRNSDALFRSLFGTLSSPILIFDPQTGKIIDANQVACVFYGYSYAELTGLCVFDLAVIPQENVRDNISMVMDKMVTIIQVQHRLASGEIRDVEIFPIQIRYKNKLALLAVIHDITERKQAEEQSIFQSKLLSRIHDAVVATDERMQITYLNQAAEELFGWTLLEAFGRSMDKLFQMKIDEDVRNQAYKTLIETGYCDGEVFFSRKNGTCFEAHARLAALYSVSGEIKGIVISIRDITDRKRSEQILKDAEQQMRIIIDAVPNLLWTAYPDGTVDFCNQSWLNFTGLDRGQIQDGGWVQALHPDDVQNNEQRWNNATHGKFIFESERRLRRFDGEYRWFLSYAQPMLDTDGKVLKWYGVDTDITERKQMEINITERVKELTCLHQVGRLVENQTISESELCSQVVECIPPAMQFPNRVMVALQMSGKTYQAGISQAPPNHCLTAPILCNNQECGNLTVIYPASLSFILPEEQYLTDNVASVLGLWHERKRSETEVRKLSLAVKQTPASVLITDVNGIIEYVNPAFTILTGYTPEEVIGLTPRFLKSELTPKEKHQNLWQTILSKQTWYGEFLNRNKTGDLYWESNIISPILDERGEITHFLALKEDITEKKQDQERIAEVMEFNQTILNASPIGLIIYKASGPCVSTNQAAGLITGIEPDVLRQQNFHTIPSWKESGLYTSAMQALETGQPVSMQFHSNNTFGKEVWLNLTYACVKIAAEPHLLLIVEDDSKRQLAESRLKLSNEKLESLVNSLEESKQSSDLLHKLDDLLQTCLSLEEAYKMITQYAIKIFPNTMGGIFLSTKTQRQVEAVVVWGQEIASEPAFTVDKCWALRQGQAYRVNSGALGVRCQHVRSSFMGCYIEMPLIALGEPLGLLHIGWPQGEDPDHNQQELMQIMAEHISLSLSNIRLRENLRQLSVRDPLTGTYNRRYMMEMIERELPRATRRQSHIGLIMLDIDFFKRFNDTFGHDAGDLVLTRLGHLLKSHLRGEDIVCRYGGEEFVLVMPDADLEVTLQRAERIRVAVAGLDLIYNTFPLGGITISAGVAVFPQHGSNGEQIIKNADVALYRAKHNGRNRVEVFLGQN